MKKIFCLLLLLAVMFSLAMPAFAEEVEVDGIVVEDGDYYARFKGKGITLNVYNWGEYIADGSDGVPDVNAIFEKLTGIKVNYTNFGSNEEMYAKIKSGGAQYDVVVPSDYMIARLIREGMLEKLDYSNIPNFEKIPEVYRNLEFDPDNEYYVPYLWGLVGLIYNVNMVDEEDIHSWDILWNERYMGNMLMFSNSRDAFGVSAFRLGYSCNTTDEAELEEIEEQLKEQKMLVQAYVQDEIYNKMLGGEAAVAPYYAGDALLMMAENDDLDFCYPDECTNYFVDAMVIPAGTRNKEAAEAYINFMCEFDVALANVEYTGCPSPIEGIADELDEDDHVIEIMYPSDEVMANTEVYTALPESTGRIIDGYWTDILSYNENANLWIGPLFLGICFGGSIFITVMRMIKKRQKTI